MVIDRGIKHELVLDTNFRIIGCRAGTIYCKSAMSICGEWEVNRLRQSCDNPARTCVSLSHDPWNQPRRITRYYWLTFFFFLNLHNLPNIASCNGNFEYIEMFGNWELAKLCENSNLELKNFWIWKFEASIM